MNLTTNHNHNHITNGDNSSHRGHHPQHQHRRSQLARLEMMMNQQLEAPDMATTTTTTTRTERRRYLLERRWQMILELRGRLTEEQRRERSKQLRQQLQEERMLKTLELQRGLEHVQENHAKFTSWTCQFMPQNHHDINLNIAIGEALAQNTHLRKLDLQHFVLGEADAEAMARGIGRSQLESLTIHTSPSEDVWHFLFQGLQSSTTLQELNLKPFPAVEIAGLEDVLPWMPSLRKLGLDSMVMSEMRAPALARGIGQCKKLESLTIRLPLGRHQGTLYALLLSEVLQKSALLTKLEVRGGTLANEGMILLAHGLRRNSSITSLVLAGCGIDDQGVALLAKHGLSNSQTSMMAQPPVLANDSSVTTSSVEQWLPSCQIETLSLPNNDFGRIGARALLHAVRDQPNLQDLDLSGNRNMGYETMTMIGEELANQQHLTHVNLSGCCAAAQGDGCGPVTSSSLALAQHQAGLALINGLICNTRIKNLLLGEYSFPMYMQREIEFYVKLNRTGRSLLSTNPGLATAVWCHILARCQQRQCDQHHAASLTFFFLRELPHLLAERTRTSTTTTSTRDQMNLISCACFTTVFTT